MKKILCAVSCAGVLCAAGPLNQVELNLGTTGANKGMANIVASYKDDDKVAAKLLFGYQGFNKELGNASFKTKKSDYELSAYLGNVFLDNGVTDLAWYLIGGYHFSRISDGVKDSSSVNADGFLWGAEIEAVANLGNQARAGFSVGYKNLYSGKKDFGNQTLKVKDDRIEILVKGDVIVQDGVYIGAKLGMNKQRFSVGSAKYDDQQFVAYATIGTTY